MQVTAYQVIQAKGATGKMSTQVQFKISNPSDQSVRSRHLQRLCAAQFEGLRHVLLQHERCKKPLSVPHAVGASQCLRIWCRDAALECCTKEAVQRRLLRPHMFLADLMHDTVQITASVSGGSTSTAKGDSLSPASSPSGGSGDCTDTPPSGTYTCEQQVS